jgi:hypothetical protein
MITTKTKTSRVVNPESGPILRSRKSRKLRTTSRMVHLERGKDKPQTRPSMRWKSEDPTAKYFKVATVD